jgi:hypothetical protein
MSQEVLKVRRDGVMTHRFVDYPPSVLDTPLPPDADGTRKGKGEQNQGTCE